MSGSRFGRLVELAFALVCLPLIALPMALGALALWWQGQGSILYAGRRVGKDGRIFTLYKFRTLVEGIEGRVGAALLQDESNSVHATRVGTWLRRLKIDEMPQIWNILKGEMSYIGPRPNRPEYYEKCLREIPGYADRVAVKPGITGLAQLYGNYYTTPRNKLRYDRLYIRNQSIRLDFKLILLNFLVFFPGRRRFFLMRVSNKSWRRAWQMLVRRPRAPRLKRLREAAAPALRRLGVPRLARRLQSLPDGHVRVLLYHFVPRSRRQAFEAQVQHVASRYRVLHPEEFAAVLEGRRTPEGPEVVFTFDDGTVSDLWAARILEQHGYRGIFFLVPDFLDAAPARKLLLERSPSYRPHEAEIAALDWAGAARLVAGGHRIGSHGGSHRRLKDLEGEAIEDEVLLSAQRLESRLQTPVEWLAFPYGRAEDLDGEALRAALSRYRACFTGVRGGFARPGRMVWRESMDPAWSPELMDFCLEGGLDLVYRGRRRHLLELEKQA